MQNTSVHNVVGLVQQWVRPVMDPYQRYRHARVIHAGRIGVGILLNLLLVGILDLPHGEWSSVSLLIVIAGLHHHGNIRQRAVERAFGTVIGAAYGLFVIFLHNYVGLTWLTYLSIAIACGVCAYHAIDKGGYIALLSAITLVIVVGGGTNTWIDGLWRAVNVLIGIGLALLLSSVLPLYATYSWRYKLADALNGCAKLYARITRNAHESDEQQLKEMAALSGLLVQLRGMLASVSKEVRIPKAQLEGIQRHLRISISCLEMLASAANSAPLQTEQTDADDALALENRHIVETLHGIARALTTGTSSRLVTCALPSAVPLPACVPLPMAGYVSVTRTLAMEIEGIRKGLADTADRWNV
jgi:uncharacterized membrane protein YccC